MFVVAGGKHKIEGWAYKLAIGYLSQNLRLGL